MAKAYRLSERAARATAKVVKERLRQSPLTPRGGKPRQLAPDTRYWGRLTEVLTAPDDGMTAPTKATVQVWKPDPDYTPPTPDDPIHFIDDEDILIDVINRDESLTGEEGAVVKIEFLHGEWSFYWVGCP